ncbi:M16 family metallopeptidase [Hymenobacter wooponensis]|uniref:Insulinase family protein n=1 Tax=Hymenobacter wooponensis TaxID=1525360 RepID=A0A4Z0MTR2_9BACT|nr:pitrilysin family protein [Hymenobacter wooponensis]TGD83183.1 insulinase family protein [Hymenobacter wooponensis]
MSSRYFLGLLGLVLSVGPAMAQQKPANSSTSKAAAASSTGTRLVEKVTRKGNELVIPYEKYVLPNGLTLIVHEDHSDPLVHVDVTYHVGSAREQVGKSGFAHFFEHMMFQGSDHVADEAHFKLVTAAGGDLNGTTNQDRTNYFETLPSNQLETGLWLEADRMGFLLDAVTQPKFETQRATVKNERGQNVDNRPYGRAYEIIGRTTFPYGHPYSWPVIGYLDDLDRSNVDDLKNFFLRWYGPNNATLTIAGDVQPAQAVRLAEKYFGPINRGPAVRNVKLPAPVLGQNRYVSYEDNITQPMLMLSMPTVPVYHPDEVALDAVADMLGGDKNSLIYKNLVKNQLAPEAFCYQSNSELAGEFVIGVMAFEGQRLDSAEARVRRTLVEFEKKGISAADLERYKTQAEVNLINSLSSVSSKASRLAQYQTLAGNPNMLPLQLQRLRALTPATVQAAYNKYLKGKPAVILSVVPKGKNELIAHADNFTIDKAGYKAPTDEYAGLKYVKAKDSFDRSKQPKPGANPVLKVPAYWQQELPNGLRVIGTRNDEVPTVTMLLTIQGGQRLLQAHPDKVGLAEMTAKMVNEGSQKYTTEELEARLKALGSSIYVTAGDDDIKVYVQSLTKNLDPTLALVEERLLHPRFDPADFERLKKQQLAMVNDFQSQARVVADLVFNGLAYGPGNVTGVAVAGTPASITSITLDDIKQFYQQSFAPNASFLTIVGDVTQQQVAPKLGFLQAWPRHEVPALATAPAAPQPDKTKLYFVAKENAPQSEIRIGYLTALPYDATGDYYRATLANYLLGGAFNSRVNLNLREDKGYTYGAFTDFNSTRFAAPFTAQAGVRADATAASVREMMKELTNYREGISADELQFLQASVGQSEALKYETGRQKAQFLSRMLEYNLKPDFVEQQAAILRQLTAADVQAAAQKNLPVDKMYIVVVGDRKYLPELRQLGYDVVETSFTNNVVAMATPATAVVPAAMPEGKTKTEDANGQKVKTKRKSGK